MVEDSQETTHFGFQTVAKSRKQIWWRMYSILSPQNMM
ncbi:Ubiquinone/menaquinone biosynthesis methyltransferase UbiE [Klebsiella pneumoniae]|uniref:Ubiquinone/menaquinone biosynthesis methyltransferase UbiE n=1 Tax=Klebsiella pneumoniae TaxID=573 RepID=A0A377THZ1_KLEPN|nr:Ubiquinone/menaquinone biosynthesis methyltransferase UbiE [Klebsiella pneumoniae]